MIVLNQWSGGVQSRTKHIVIFSVSIPLTTKQMELRYNHHSGVSELQCLRKLGNFKEVLKCLELREMLIWSTEMKIFAITLEIC